MTTLHSNNNMKALSLAYKTLISNPSAQRMDMEQQRRDWIWEFLLKYCSDVRIIEQLAQALPIPNNSVLLKRLFLLRSLSFDLTNDAISERTLDAIRAIVELDRLERTGGVVLGPREKAQGEGDLLADDVLNSRDDCNSLRELCVSIMVECTIQHLREESDDWPTFYRALDKYWGDCVEDTEEREEGAESQKMLALRYKLWEVRKHPNLRHEVLRKYQRCFVKDKLQSFLDDAWKKLRPTFLETLAENIEKGNTLAKQTKAFHEGTIQRRVSHLQRNNSCIRKEMESGPTVLKTVAENLEKGAPGEGSLGQCLGEKPDFKVDSASENDNQENQEQQDLPFVTMVGTKDVVLLDEQPAKRKVEEIPASSGAPLTRISKRMKGVVERRLSSLEFNGNCTYPREVSENNQIQGGVDGIEASNDILPGRRTEEKEDKANRASETAVVQEEIFKVPKQKSVTVRSEQCVKLPLPTLQSDSSCIRTENRSRTSGVRRLRNVLETHNVQGGTYTIEACNGRILEDVTEEKKRRANKVSEIEDPALLEKREGKGKPRKEKTATVRAEQMVKGKSEGLLQCETKLPKAAVIVEDNCRNKKNNVESDRRTAEPPRRKMRSSLSESFSLDRSGGDSPDPQLRKVKGTEKDVMDLTDSVEPKVSEKDSGRTCSNAEPDQVEEPISLSPPPWAGSPGPHHREFAATSVNKKRRLGCYLDAEGNPSDLRTQNEANVEAAEILKARHELQESIAELHTAVTDPLPEALEIANKVGSLRDDVTTFLKNKSVEEQEAPPYNKQPAISIADASTSSKAITGREVIGERENEKHIKRSLMDRNPTARTYEWEEMDDISETPNDVSPSLSKRVHLLGTRMVEMRPLQGKKAMMDDQPRRRTHTKWSQVEEDTLKKEVDRYGKGRWKFILQRNIDIFENRTEVDLKDKWRNIERREGIHH